MSPKTIQRKTEKPLDQQPVSEVVWVPRERLSANDWNPNHQAPPEFRLLALSILENGWTQPIVVRRHVDPDGRVGDRLEIVDGFHRWLVAEKPEVAELTHGMVPIVVLPPTDDATARMATIRHNRARGVHGVMPMADIVADLVDRGLEPPEIGRRLGMDEEEVERLLDRGQMPKRGGTSAFGEAWNVG